MAGGFKRPPGKTLGESKVGVGELEVDDDYHILIQSVACTFRDLT